MSNNKVKRMVENIIREYTYPKIPKVTCSILKEMQMKHNELDK